MLLTFPHSLTISVVLETARSHSLLFRLLMFNRKHQNNTNNKKKNPNHLRKRRRNNPNKRKRKNQHQPLLLKKKKRKKKHLKRRKPIHLIFFHLQLLILMTGKDNSLLLKTLKLWRLNMIGSGKTLMKMDFQFGKFFMKRLKEKVNNSLRPVILWRDLSKELSKILENIHLLFMVFMVKNLILKFVALGFGEVLKSLLKWKNIHLLNFINSINSLKLMKLTENCLKSTGLIKLRMNQLLKV